MTNMSEKYQIGLTRSRLFEFDNAVVFSGRIGNCSAEVCAKALKVLALREPLLTAVAEIADDGKCYVVTGALEPQLEISRDTADNIKKHLQTYGLNFTDKLFAVYLSCDGYIVIAGHTLVADCKSLLRLAVGFARICRNGISSVVPSDVFSFADETQIPVEVNSPLTDKLSAELDSVWQKKARVYSADDYKRASQKYRANKAPSGEIPLVLDGEFTSQLNLFCQSNCVDASSVVAYAFYKVLSERISHNKKNGKMCIHADRRLFLNGAGNCLVGPFNGFCEACLSAKEQKLSIKEQVKAFHFACYKGITSSFKTFYDELLLMKVSPSYCDSMFMFLSGEVTDRASKKLACNYGCMNEQLCEFFSCNLEQNYWSELDFYEDACVEEPFKNRFATSVTLLLTHGKCKIRFCYKDGKLSKEQGEAVIESVKNLLLDIVN